MTPAHGTAPLGIILALPELDGVSASQLETLQYDLIERGLTRLLHVTRQPTEMGRSNWRNIIVGDVSYDTAIEIAKRHLQMCERVVVLNSMTMPDLGAGEPMKPAPFTDWAPVRGGHSGEGAWEGAREVKPWDFACEVTIPVLDASDTLPMVIELLRAQSIKPFISLIDCGSTPKEHDWLESLRADDLEIHTLRFNGVKHISDFPAASLDLAFSICRSPVLVAMHSDVFLRQRTSLEQLVEMCDYDHPAVGFQMTKRDFPGWDKAITHTFAAFLMGRMDEIGGSWSLRRAARLAGFWDGHQQRGPMGSFMDTEACLALVLKQAGIEPTLIGPEENFEMTVHPLVRHVRTLTGGRLYSPAHAEKCKGWLAEALAEAAVNLTEWSGEGGA
jgi:hypothetical protein